MCSAQPVFSENHSLEAHGEDTAKLALSLFEKMLSLPCTLFAVGPRTYRFMDVSSSQNQQETY